MPGFTLRRRANEARSPVGASRWVVLGGLVRREWKKEELKRGDRVAVAGYGAKNGSNVANASTVTLPDGRKFFGGFQETPDNPFK